jgi:hypothetical protein
VFESNSMNGLGLAAFDDGGATAWREVTLPVAPDGDVVEIDMTVTNVGDDLLDSQVSSTWWTSAASSSPN